MKRCGFLQTQDGNVISGPGMLDFKSSQSLVKLVLDNEICGMALRMVRGIDLPAISNE